MDGTLAAADIAEQPDVLRRVLGANAGRLERARDVVASARVVRLCGFGSSKHVAGYGAEALDVIGGRPSSVLPAPGAAVAWPEPRRDEPLIVLSQSGRTPALLDAAQRARDAEVEVIAVTNEPASPLEGLATLTLVCDAGDERVVAATKSVTAQCLLLRAIASPVSDDAIASLADAVDLAAGVDVAVPRPVAVVASGFAAEWVADELALKITEMCGFAVTSNSTVEHFHGPKAGGGAVLAFLDPSDPNAADLARSDVVTTVGPDETYDVRTPSTGDASLDAIVTLVAGQRIARALALSIGEDPDAPRGLLKVTDTR